MLQNVKHLKMYTGKLKNLDWLNVQNTCSLSSRELISACALKCHSNIHNKTHPSMKPTSSLPLSISFSKQQKYKNMVVFLQGLIFATRAVLPAKDSCLQSSSTKIQEQFSSQFHKVFAWQCEKRLILVFT